MTPTSFMALYGGAHRWMFGFRARISAHAAAVLFLSNLMAATAGGLRCRITSGGAESSLSYAPLFQHYQQRYLEHAAAGTHPEVHWFSQMCKRRWQHAIKG